MTDESSLPTRRSLLASIGGVGAFGAAGAKTLASLSDEEGVSGDLQAGSVNVDVTCDGCNVKDGRLQLGLGSISPGESNSKTLQLSVPEGTNPVRLWFRTGCPPVPDPLGAALEARVAVRPNCDDAKRRYPLGDEWISFSELRREFHGGIRLDDPDDPCLGAGEQLCLDVEYRLPEDATGVVGAETGLVLDFYAQQCRHVSENDVESPFPDEECPAAECPDCVKLGKLEVSDDQLSIRTYDFDEQYGEFEGDDAYELEVFTVTNKEEEGNNQETVCASVGVLKDGSESAAPPICKVDVKGGDVTETYDIDPPTTRTRGEVCSDPEGNNASGKRPAISNLTVYVCSEEVGADG
ncbi:hypothetical protein ACFQDG_09860 [Natronoarchaeum mannanilyticum]|uniref:SipW-cognate class signal peptide n=1 Tax=Natronoarchaeum mannanilyticum TaxID=926360 RepID=A0AAV3T8S4_9EURY